MSDQLLRGGLRGIAVAIAVVAAIDPSFTSDRSAKPDVSVIAVNAHADSVAANRVADRLSKSFTVLRAPLSGSVATVLVGSNAGSALNASGGALFTVYPTQRAGVPSVRRLQVPATTALGARVSVLAAVDVRGAKGKALQLSLSSNGSVVDRASHTVEGDSGVVELPLSFVPTAIGTVALRVNAVVSGAADTASADAVLTVRDEKWAVLFFDSRPSWMSTFVRRAVERDPRFSVTSRIVTAINISTDAGKPPVTIDDAAVAELYDAIVVGAPESLSERDAQGLERFLRRRGGSVVLLFDENKSGRYQRLAEFPGFTNTANSLPAVISEASADTAMRTTEWMWPTRLPDGADVLAWTGNANSALRRPIVWTTSAGAGRIVVSGALDAWKFRDGKQSAFERFWQQTVASAAASASPAVSIQLPTAPVAPGADAEIRVTSRAAALAELRADRAVRSEMAVVLTNDSIRVPVAMWPTGAPGEFRGTLHAPSQSGNYTLSAATDGATGTAPLVVAGDARVANPDERTLLAAASAASGGQLIDESDLASLPALVADAVRPASRRIPWHPMRSAWWLLPFVGALSAEWFLRRRKGMP